MDLTLEDARHRVPYLLDKIRELEGELDDATVAFEAQVQSKYKDECDECVKINERCATTVSELCAELVGLPKPTCVEQCYEYQQNARRVMDSMCAAVNERYERVAHLRYSQMMLYCVASGANDASLVRVRHDLSLLQMELDGIYAKYPQLRPRSPSVSLVGSDFDDGVSD